MQNIEIRESLLLATLSDKQYRQLRPEVVPLSWGDTLYSADDEMSHVYFPGRNTMISLSRKLRKPSQPNRGNRTGRGGADRSGVGRARSPHQVLVQIPGAAVAFPVPC